MSAAPVFSAASIAGCIFTVLVSIALPVAALAVLKRKTGRGLLAALVGAGCFIGYALVLDGGRVLPDRAAARTHPQMTIRFRDGEMQVMQPNKEGAYGSEKEADV